MKSKYIIYLIFLSIGFTTSCKKFLYVKPIDELTGNNFWRSKKDAEAAINGAYRRLLDHISYSTLYNDGDFRAGGWNWFNKKNFQALAENRMLSPELNSQDHTGDPAVSWVALYRVIAAANLCIDRIPGIDDPSFSQSDKKKLVAEARFIRAFTYFFMVRLYGDIPLQFNAYDQSRKPRTSMITILDTCIQDLAKSKDDLPVAYTDPSNRAVRATRGADLTLMANMYMWKAGFDTIDRKESWQKAADLAGQVMDLGVYKLLPYSSLKDMQTIFKGRSKEGIFELSFNANYGVSTPNIISRWTLHEPYIHSNPNLYAGKGSEITPKKTMLDKLYPSGTPDKRLQYWFEDPYSTTTKTPNPQAAMFLKFSSVANKTNIAFDANYIFFRYGGLILTRAEALAHLNQTEESIALLDSIRHRAGLADYNGGGGQALLDAIFNERRRELMGEGWLWYDLVRTRRVLDPNETSNFLRKDEFDKGAWTWPIPPSAIQNNPLVTQTIYWLNG